MALSVGNNNVAGMSVGTDEVASAYWGNSEVWSENKPANTCTVANLGAVDPSTVTFTKNGTIDYDFEEVTINGNVFIKIPTFYRKVETVVDNQITSFTLSDTKIDNTYEPYTCFLKPNGDLMNYVLIGKYCMSSTSVANSVNATKASMTIGTGRSLAEALGVGYQLYDWQLQRLFVDLALCKSEKVNFNDGVEIQEYLGIAHLSYSCFIDGICNNIESMYISYNPSKYIDSPTSLSDSYTTISYHWANSAGYVSKLGYDANNPFVNYASKANGSVATFYCDSYEFNNLENYTVRTSVGGASAYSGLFYIHVKSKWTATNSVRLCYRPL